MSNVKIQEGDTVWINIDGEEKVVIHGVVRSMPVATGDSWIIESEWGLHYVQQFHVMTRQPLKRPPTTQEPTK